MNDPLVFRDNATLLQWYESRSLEDYPTLSFPEDKRVAQMSIEEYKKTDSYEKEKDLNMNAELIQYFDRILVQREDLSADERQEIFYLSENLIDPYGMEVQDYIKDLQSKFSIGGLFQSALCFVPVSVTDIVSAIKFEEK